MSRSRALTLVCFVTVQITSTAFRLERVSNSPDGVAQSSDQAVIVDWQSEYALFRNRSQVAARTAQPSDAERKDQRAMGEAVRALKEASHQPHLVLIGDSMMRQQYFNLASWFIHGEARPSEPKRMPEGNGYQAFWKGIWRHQNKQLQSDSVSEICHCGRHPTLPADSKDAFAEDRFVALPDNGPSISYFGWFADYTFHGYFNPSNETPTQATCRVGECSTPFRWMVKQNQWRDGQGVVHLLKSVIKKLHPKPTHVVINCGFWGHLTSRGLKNMFAAGAEIQKDDGIRFVWKTMTHLSPKQTWKHPELQGITNMQMKLARQYGWDVFDAYSVSHKYPEDYYFDGVHMADKGSTNLNSRFLEALLKSLQ
jgi:hypothetical protein